MIDQFQQLVEQERHRDMLRRAQAAALVTAIRQASETAPQPQPIRRPQATPTSQRTRHLPAT